MKNFEHYKDVFMRCKGRNLECIASKKILKRKCDNNCAICVEFIKKWLYKEYKEPIKPTEDEKAILRNLPKKYEYIARDYNGNLYLYTKKPQKVLETDYWANTVDGTSKIFNIYEHLFKFIKWRDAEPYNIEELIKEE